MTIHLTLNSHPEQVTAAINQFNPSYHDDYLKVRQLAQRYFQYKGKPDAISANALSVELIKVLKNWGAGKRKAPSCVSEEVLTLALCDLSFANQLRRFELASRFTIIENGQRRILCNDSWENIHSFDLDFIHALRSISRLVFQDNTSVTYPMKTMLLLTGCIPALDSQVRTGAHLAGLKGMKKTKFLMPEPGSKDAEKISAFLFLCNDFFLRHNEQLQHAIRNSNYPELIQHPGRIMDILFFKQQDVTTLKLCNNTNPVREWYRI